MKKLVCLFICLTIFLMLVGCSEEKVALSQQTLDKTEMEAQAVSGMDQEEDSMYPLPEEQAFYSCKTEKECRYGFSFWRLQEGKWMESKLNEGSIDAGEHDFTIYLEENEEGYGAGVKIEGDSRTVYYYLEGTPNEGVYLNESKEFSAKDRIILAVGGENAADLKPEEIESKQDMENLSARQEGVYLLSVQFS